MRLQDITGANILSSILLDVCEDDFGAFGKLSEVIISGRRCMVFTKSNASLISKTFCTILLCCPEESTMSDISSVMKNALRCVNDVHLNGFAVAGAGCFEIHLVDYLSTRLSIATKEAPRCSQGSDKISAASGAFISRISCEEEEKKMIFRALREIMNHLSLLPGYLDLNNHQNACERLKEANCQSLHEQRNAVYDWFHNTLGTCNGADILFGWDPIEQKAFPVWTERTLDLSSLKEFVLDDGLDKKRALLSALEMAMECFQMQHGVVLARSSQQVLDYT
uniref:Uncharacterized protein n=1 Tax=Guillardia theta TaxID=55529 RepID=A0A6U5Z5B4_GUITH|mmetsp:Transcript_24195/g.78845  ORF Transcript_24195/g.78845 Transcript_24195/m.78845 type:complete len:280 (+) Transcript_24195:1506-2345(+)